VEKIRKIRDYAMVKFVLIDTISETKIRHGIRTYRKANAEREWYENELGRDIRIEKIFKSE
jgi:hypothetical protein